MVNLGNMKRVILLFSLFFIQFCLGQNQLTGTVTDQNSIPLEGVEVRMRLENQIAITDKMGTFRLETDLKSGRLLFSYVGYVQKTVEFRFKTTDQMQLEPIRLQQENYELEEVRLIGKGIVDLDKNRNTPTAVSTITRDQIQLKAAGNVEFPNILRHTPSTYISSESGGFGDGQLFVRGFDQSNTAFLLNGQPVNGMQNGQLFWSNWNGLTDIVNTVQVQRGLGSSKLAVSSAGGTVNMITKATERNQGGFARFLIGNDSFLETTVSYDTGINENGWGFSFLLDYWKAHRKYARGTKGEGQNYFFSLGKKSGNHNFNFLLTGAPLIHDQNPSKSKELYAVYGNKYNNQYGFRNGKYLAEQRKFYHKPIFNFNWDWAIAEGSQLAAVLYASFGHGGGTLIHGQGIGSLDYPAGGNQPIQAGAYHPHTGLIDWDFVVETANQGLDYSHNGQGTLLGSTVNNNQYYGGILNYEHQKIKNLDLNIGVDIRFYRDNHFKQLVDPLGLKGRIENFGGNPNHRVTKTYKADPWAVLFNYAGPNERVGYDHAENINYQGMFGQAEWANEHFSAFIQGSVSNQSYKKLDRGGFSETQISDILNKIGYNLKGGASWKWNPNQQLFANVGKYSRQPFLNNIFTSFTNRADPVNRAMPNEEIVGLEAGYRYRKNNLEIHLDAYYTQWKNRLLTTTGSYDPQGDYTNPEFRQVTYFFGNIAQLHRGLELDIHWQPLTDWRIHGFVGYGNWEYRGTTPVRIQDVHNQSLIDELTTDLKATKVGQAPQTTLGVGVDYFLLPARLNVYGNWNYYGRFYGFVDVGEAALNTLRGETYRAERLNSYSLTDLGASYVFYLGGNRFQFTGNVYNLWGHQYVSQRNNSGYYMGNGRTYNFSLKFFF